VRITISQEGLPGAKATTELRQVAKEEELESIWGMLRQPMVGMRCLPTLVRSGTLPGGPWRLNPF
jgi:hypothetical protein